MTRWSRIVFAGAMTHVVPASLLAPLVADMKSRGVDFDRAWGENPRLVDKWSFDCGGFWVKGEPEETLYVDGLAIDIPCCQFDAVVAGVERASERVFATGDRYHKLKFWIHATVLTPEQYQLVLDELHRIAATARDRGHQFDEAFKRSLAAGGVS